MRPSRFRANNDAFIGALMSMRRLTYLSGGVPGLLLSAGSGLVFLVGGMRVIDHAITMGTLVAFVAYQMRLVWPIQALMGLYASLASARVSLKRVSEILDAPVDVVEAPNAVSLPSARGRLTLESVTYAFGRGGPVLDGVSLDVRGRRASGDRRAQRRGQVDDRGSLRAAARSAGRTRAPRRRRSARRAARPTFAVTCSSSIRIRSSSTRRSPRTFATRRPARATNVCARPPTPPDWARCSIDRRSDSRRAPASADARSPPENVSDSSLARAFLADPAVLVLDEATGALDPATEAQVAAGYEAVMAGRTTIIITHRLELARRADRVLVLERGRIVEEGTAATLLGLGQSFASLFSSGTLQQTH